MGWDGMDDKDFLDAVHGSSLVVGNESAYVICVYPAASISYGRAEITSQAHTINFSY